MREKKKEVKPVASASFSLINAFRNDGKLNKIEKDVEECMKSQKAFKKHGDLIKSM